MAPRLALVCGKPPRSGTIIAEAARLLAAWGWRARVVTPRDADVREVVAAADVIVHRGLAVPDVLQVAQWAGPGPVACNPFAGQLRVADRLAVHGALAAAGVPTPRTVPAPTWREARVAAERGRVVVKTLAPVGRGGGVVPSPLPAQPPCPGPWVVEDHIAHDGWDRKVYVAGEFVGGLLKPSTLVAEHVTSGTPFDPGPELTALARRALAALDLHLAGVDVVVGPDGPVVVDVNPFPGYRGVEGAADAVAAHLLGHLERWVQAEDAC